MSARLSHGVLFAFRYLAVSTPVKTLFIAVACLVLAALGFFLSVVSLIVSPCYIYFSTLFESHYLAIDRDSVFKRRGSCISATATTTHSENSVSVEMHSSGRRLNSTPDPCRQPTNTTVQPTPPGEQCFVSHRNGMEGQEAHRRMSLPPHFSEELRTDSPPPLLRTCSTTSVGIGTCFPHSRKPRSSKRPERAISPFELLTFSSGSNSPPGPSFSPLAGTDVALVASPPTPKHTPSVVPKTSLRHLRRALHHPLHRHCSKEAHKVALIPSKFPEPETPLPPILRTRPYEAPYFFPLPGSPEAVGYVQRAREDLRMNPSASGSGVKQKANRETKHGRTKSLSPMGHHATAVAGEGDAEADVTLSAPPASVGKKVKKGHTKGLSSSGSVDESRREYGAEDVWERGVGTKPKLKSKKLRRAR